MASAIPANDSSSWIAPLGNTKEGTAIRTDPNGLEWLVSSKEIAAANWTISVMLPTHEAFEPVREQQSRLTLATWVLSMAAAAVTWWLLRRQLFPIRSTVHALSQRSNSELPLRPLPLTQQAEIDLLIGGFNSLLLELSNRTDELRAGVTLNRDTLNSVEAHIAVLNAQGDIIAINQRWQDYLNRLSQDGAFGATGKHYKTLFASRLQQNQTTPQSLVEGVSAVLQGEKSSFTLEYAVQDPGNLHWFYLSVTPLGTDRHGAVISRTDISERKLAESLIRQLSRVAEQAPISIVITDLRGSMEYTNPYFSEVTGYSALEVAGQNPRMLKSGLTPAVVYQSLWASLRARRTWRGELHNRKKTATCLQ
jgi:PAS domain-containing protein